MSLPQIIKSGTNKHFSKNHGINQFNFIAGIHMLAENEPDKFLNLFIHAYGYKTQPKTIHPNSPSYYYSSTIKEMLGLDYETSINLGYSNPMECLDIIVEYILETLTTSFQLKLYQTQNKKFNSLEANLKIKMLPYSIN